ncbi:MAG: acyltransferase [Myxococcota bacterium]
MGVDAAYEDFAARRYFDPLDAVRAISIVAVAWHHAHGGWPDVALSLRGFLGVDMFFVLSGFLIATLLLRERDRSGGISLRRFYARRTLRIFPLYYAVVLGLGVLSVVRPGSSIAASVPAALPYLLTYTSNWVNTATILSIAWSLATEEQFYLLWPPIEKWAARFAGPALLLALGINQLVNFGVLDVWLAEVWGPETLRLEVLDSTFTPILLGIVLAHWMHERASFGWVRRVAGFGWAPLLWAVLLLAACSWPVSDLSGLPRLGIQLAMVGWLASLVLHRGPALKAAAGWLPLRRLGVVSYGIYLLHMFALHPAGLATDAWFGGSRAVRFVLCLLLAWGAAELSFRWFESPILKLKRRFAAVR